MNPQTASSDHEPLTDALDTLVLALNSELELLETLHYRLTVLRLVLLEGNPRFITAAAADVDAATQRAASHEPQTAAAVRTARETLGTDASRLVDLAAAAPTTHRQVLVRLTREIERTSRSLSALRDAVRRQSENGRAAMAAVLDLTDGSTTPGGASHEPGHVFRGVI